MNQSMIQFADEQTANLQRVRGRIAGLVLRFLHSVGVGGRFHVSQLHDFVSQKAQVAPASADRVLRLLRQEGAVAFTVTNRAASEYRLDRVTNIPKGGE